MKKLAIIILMLTFTCCHSNLNKGKGKIAYEQGITILRQNNVNGKVNYLKALESFDQSIKFDSENIESFYWKIQCEFHLKKFDEALRSSETAIKICKNRNHKLLPKLYTTAGLVEKINGKTENSNLYFEKANEVYNIRIKENEKEDDVMNKALVLCYMDKKNEALDFLNSINLTNKNKNSIEQIKQSIKDFNVDEFLLNTKNNEW
jgi:tetratricopeptide (TPR) repeat protein